jgi:Raf kinase inhibitor-like YbhB/YbcL family protein
MTKYLRLALFSLSALLFSETLALAGTTQTGPSTTRLATMKLAVTSPAFHDGQTIPKEYTADGKNVSPPIKWSTPPNGTKSLALICEDPDAPAGTWVHWVVYGIPAGATGLAESVPSEGKLANGAKQGTNSFRKVGYGGPSPPPGKPHRYFFKVYAVDFDLSSEAHADAKQIEEKIAGHTLAAGQLIGTYGR